MNTQPINLLQRDLWVDIGAGDYSHLPFKEQVEKQVIPTIERMIIKEKAHREFLEKHTHLPSTIGFLANSQAFLNHLNYRLNEYKQYIQQP